MLAHTTAADDGESCSEVSTVNQNPSGSSVNTVEYYLGSPVVRRPWQGLVDVHDDEGPGLVVPMSHQEALDRAEMEREEAETIHQSLMDCGLPKGKMDLLTMDFVVNTIFKDNSM